MNNFITAGLLTVSKKERPVALLIIFVTKYDANCKEIKKQKQSKRVQKKFFEISDIKHV